MSWEAWAPGGFADRMARQVQRDPDNPLGHYKLVTRPVTSESLNEAIKKHNENEGRWRAMMKTSTRSVETATNRRGHWAVMVHWPSKNSRCGRSASEPVSEQRFNTLSEALAARQSFEDKEQKHVAAGSSEGFRFVACFLSVDKGGNDRWQKENE